MIDVRSYCVSDTDERVGSVDIIRVDDLRRPVIVATFRRSEAISLAAQLAGLFLQEDA